MPHARTLTYIATATLGLALWLFGALDDGHIDLADIRTAGVLVLTFTFLAVIAGRSVVSARAVEAARQGGYDDGFAEGHEATMPPALTLVTSDGSAPIATVEAVGLCSPQQLHEQRDVGRGANRVG